MFVFVLNLIITRVNSASEIICHIKWTRDMFVNQSTRHIQTEIYIIKVKVRNFWQYFPFLQKVFLFLFHFFPINVMSSAYANAFSCSLPIFIPLWTIFILCITFCNSKLNNIVDKGSPCFKPVLFSKKYDSVPFILTALTVFFTHI